jgi:hypothetical protein
VLVALRQARLKLLIAYSTVAPIGQLSGDIPRCWEAAMSMAAELIAEARPRPDRKARRHRPSASDNRARFRARRPVADRLAAQRRHCRESDVAQDSSREGPMVLDRGRADRRIGSLEMIESASR